MDDILNNKNLLMQINEIENMLRNIKYCDLIIFKYKNISICIMEYITCTKYEKELEINPLMVYKIINNELLIENKKFISHIHDVYCDMMNKYIQPDYYKRINEEYMSIEAKIYKIYIFRITAEKKLNTFKPVEKYNKELEGLLKKYVLLIT
jgi:hypothetical protein